MSDSTLINQMVGRGRRAPPNDVRDNRVRKHRATNMQKLLIGLALAVTVSVGLSVAAQAGYSSVDEFVVHLLEKAAADAERAQGKEEIRKRLQGLGYIE